MNFLKYKKNKFSIIILCSILSTIFIAGCGSNFISSGVNLVNTINKSHEISNATFKISKLSAENPTKQINENICLRETLQPQNNNPEAYTIDYLVSRSAWQLTDYYNHSEIGQVYLAFDYNGACIMRSGMIRDFGYYTVNGNNISIKMIGKNGYYDKQPTNDTYELFLDYTDESLSVDYSILNNVKTEKPFAFIPEANVNNFDNCECPDNSSNEDSYLVSKSTWLYYYDYGYWYINFNPDGTCEIGESNAPYYETGYYDVNEYDITLNITSRHSNYSNNSEPANDSYKLYLNYEEESILIDYVIQEGVMFERNYVFKPRLAID